MRNQPMTGSRVVMSAARGSESPGRWLRGQRTALGLTQEDLAERSGVSVRTIADLERGRTRRPYPNSVRALIRALGLRLSETAPDDPYMQLVRASALNGSAWYNAHLGELGQARAHCARAIELCRSIGYSPGEAGTWDTLGFVWQRLGDHASAVTCFLNAIALGREMGNRD